MIEQLAQIDKTSGIPIYVQLSEQIRLLVRRRALTPGSPLPTVRALAVELGVNANTIARVYRDLQREGLLRLERGVGTFVSEITEERTIGEDDFRAISDRTRKLVTLSRRCGLTRHELSQLVESLWKEQVNAER